MSEEDIPFPVEPTAATHFAWANAFLALQRTHMAAVRTASSLIGFGFTVAEFFERLQMAGLESVHRHPHAGPRNFGLLLIAAGILSLSIFTVQYRRAMAYLRSAPFAAIAGIGRKVLTMPIYLMSYAVIAIGVVAFVAVFIKL